MSLITKSKRLSTVLVFIITLSLIFGPAPPFKINSPLPFLNSVLNGMSSFISTSFASAEDIGTTDTFISPVDYKPISSPEKKGLADALLVQDYYPWMRNSDAWALQEAGITYDVTNSWNLSKIDLSVYKFIMYASDQPTSYYNNIASNVNKIEDFVSNGGLLIAHVFDIGWNHGDWRGKKILPGNVTHKNYWDNWNYATDYIKITDLSHPVVNGLSDSYLSRWNDSAIGILNNLPAGTDKVMVSNNSFTSEPTYIDYNFGSGKVLATTQAVEWGYFSWWLDRPELLRNELRYAKNWGRIVSSREAVYGTNNYSGYTSEPINTAIGNCVSEHQDIYIPGKGLPALIKRTYNSMDNETSGPFGNGWTYNYNLHLT